jgi:uncharacterized OB-fold protein
MSAPLPRKAPEVMPEAREFWEATAHDELKLQRCAQCDAVVWYPRGVCPICLSSNLSWFHASGHGTIYSYTISRKGEGEFRAASPFVLAYVELDEGPRILTNIVDVDLQSITIGMPVVVVFDDTGAGLSLVRFRPA